MFDPCTDGQCKGRDRSGWGNHECKNCRLIQLENQVSLLQYRIRNELEPRINAERIAYDNWVTNPEK